MELEDAPPKRAEYSYL